MSSPSSQDPRREASAQSDEALLQSHEVAAEKWKTEDGARYRMVPLVLLFVLGGLLFAGGSYFNRYTGHFDSNVYHENGKPGGAMAAAPKAIDPVVLGKRQYQAACMTCHQINGLGVPGAFPPLAGSEWVNGSEERLIRVVLHGLGGEIEVKGAKFNGAMPSFGQVPGSGYNWRDEQIAAVLTYVRQEWGNQAPAIAKEKVAEIRAKETRTKAWTAAELAAFAN